MDEKHQYWMKRNTFYQNISLYTFNIGWKETHFIKIHFCIISTLDEKHQYWMKSIDIGWKETHFIKIQICTPILDEKNTFFQNIHLFTFNIGWKETHFYQSTQLHDFNIAPKETHFIKIPICTPSLFDEKNTFYPNIHLYTLNIEWKKKHLSKYKFVLQYPMKRTHFIKIYICSPSTLDESKHIFIKIHNCVPSILDEKKHILSKYKFVLQYWKKRTHFIKIYISTPSTLDERKLIFIKIHNSVPSILDEMRHILSKYTFVFHQYWMKSINIGWKETHFYQNTHLCSNIGWKEHILSKYTFEHLEYYMKKNTYQNTNLYSNIWWKEHISSKYTFVHLQQWMKGTHFMKILFWNPSILNETHQYWMKRNTFYQNTNLYSNIGRKEHILSKSTLVHLQHWMKGNTFLSRYTILCLQYWMKWNILSTYTFVSYQYWMKSSNIGWKETHFIKIQICTPWILHTKNTFYQNIHLYTLNITWKKHLSKYKFVLQYPMKRTHFIKIYICTPSTMDEREHIFIKIHFWIPFNIGWKASMLDEKDTFYQNISLYSNIEWKEHILSKYTFVHHQHWMKWNTFYQNTLLYPINIGWTASILDEKHRYWMKRNTFYQNISLYTFNIGWKETHFIKIYFCIPSILDEKHQYWMKSIDIGWKETHFIKIYICTPSTLDEKKHILSKYKFVLQYWMKRTHFFKIYICSPSTLDERKHIFIKVHNCMPSILHQKKHILSKYLFVHLHYSMKRTHFIQIYICTSWILNEKKNTYQDTNLFSNIRWKEHILSKYAFVHHQHWMKGNTFLSRYTILCLQYWMKWKILSTYTFVSYQYWMKRNTFYQNTNLYSNIGWKEHILSKYTFVHLQHWMKGNTFLSAYTIACLQYWMKRNTFYQNTNLYSNIGWKEHILSKYTFVHHQRWMKWNTFYQNTLLYPINIGWTASILDEKHRYWMKRNTFYQNISLYTFNIGWKETHFIKIYFCIPSILDEKHQYWMKSIDIGWKETHFIKIRICTPILDEKNTFYQNIHLFTFNIGWNCMPWILDEKHQYWMKKKHLSKYKFVLQYPMKRTHFIKIQICTPILDEKNTFFQNIHLYTINIGWNETHFIKTHFSILSILDEQHQYWMKSINIGWKETHFIKI